jgi:hypothetical protein
MPVKTFSLADDETLSGAAATVNRSGKSGAITEFAAHQH